MKLLTFAVSLVFLAILPFVVSASERAAWDYEGRFGPENWVDLSTEFEACGRGEQQSPVDLVGALETELGAIELHWPNTDWELRNNGHTVAAYPMEQGHAIIENMRYELVHFQLHNPSEHMIGGRSYPMEAQFVHQSKAGDLAVIGVMIKGGGRNPLFETFMASAPVAKNSKTVLRAFDPTELTTDLGDILRYEGSLTAPPCTENVMWTVLTDPLVVSDAALLAFNSLFAHNSRPVQPLNRRYVLSD